MKSVAKADLPTKICANCGFSFTWRKHWERDWDNVRMCSDGCRRGKLAPGNERYAEAVVALLSKRGPSASICPSEVARALSANEWRPLMDAVRAAGARLAQRGVVVITQGDREVDLCYVVGPVRFRRGPSFVPASAKT